MPNIAAQANKLLNYYSITYSCIFSGKCHKTFSEDNQETVFITDRNTDKLHANQVQ